MGSFIPERSPAHPRRSSTLDYILHSQMWLWIAGTPPQLFRSPSRPPRPTCFGRGSPSTSVCPVGLCLVAAVLSYMVARGSSAGPLFHWEDGKFMTRARFVESMRTALTLAGYRAKDYAGHSFHIGAATTAAQRGIQDLLI